MNHASFRGTLRIADPHGFRARGLTDVITATQLRTALDLAERAGVDIFRFSAEHFGCPPQTLSIRGGTEILTRLEARQRGVA